MTFVEVTVKSLKGTCHFGHRVGDKIVFNERTVKGPICYSALTTIRLDCMPCVLAQNFRGKETRMSSTVFVQTMRTPLFSRSDA